MMKYLVLALLVTVVFAPRLAAQPASLTYGEDYTYTGEVQDVTTVQVAPNRVDHYLAGLARSWVPANEIAIEMGLMTGYNIYVSELANSGDFNVVLVTRYENAAQRNRFEDPDTFAEFDSRVEEALSEQESFEITEGYTDIRDIVGQYLMREVQLQ